MADFEISFLIALLSTLNNNKEIITISEDLNPITNAYGISFNPKMKISDIKSLNDIDGLIIPGGSSISISTNLSKLIIDLDMNKKLLAAICYGPLFLARAGVLGNNKYTTTAMPEALAELKQEDPFNRDYYMDQAVVIDNHFITAIGSAFIDFAIEVADYLGLIADENEKMELARVYKNI
jgi:putative intracellular protease/amidase